MADDNDFALKQYLDMALLDGDQPGEAVARIDIGPPHLNPNGVVHGAVLFAMVDTAMGKATMEVIEEGCYCASVEVQLRFIRAVASGVLEARASVLKRGRHVVHLEARAIDADGRLIATASGTFAVLRPDRT